MKYSSKLAVMVLVCLAMSACKQHAEETSAKEKTGNDAENTGEMQRKLPECAKRNKDGTYKHGSACTAEQWIEWQKSQDALNAPTK